MSVFLPVAHMRLFCRLTGGLRKKFFSSVKNIRFRFLTETTQKFFATVEAFLLCCIGKHLRWNALIGRQMQVNFCYSSNRTSADCQLLGDVVCTFASPKLILFRSDQFTNLRNVGSSSHAFRPSTASLSINCWTLASIRLHIALRVLKLHFFSEYADLIASAPICSLFTQSLHPQFVFHWKFTHCRVSYLSIMLN